MENKKIPPTVNMISLGCPRTLVDSELYLGRLEKVGYRTVKDPEGADVVLINTCSFVQDSIKESVDTVLEAVRLKNQGKCKAVVVAGCLVQRFKDKVIDELPEVDGFIGVDGFNQVDRVVNQALAGKKAQHLKNKPLVPHRGRHVPRSSLTPSHYAYLKVSEGCLKGCSFCIIPKIKGTLQSRPIEAVVSEAKQLVEERGVQELIVVGQDTSDYGVDLYKKPRIAPLIAKLSRINGVRWVRLLYCHPWGIDQELIETLRDEPNICNYLDMAIEHTDDQVLKRMNRKVTQRQIRDVVGSLRKAMPDIALRTSVIVGFPGETQEAFSDMLRVLQELKFERLGAFQYSPEQGSAAIRFPDQVSEAVKQKRFERLMSVQQAIATEVNGRQVGQVSEVVIDEVDEQDPTVFIGRTSADCPEVDGVVYVKSDQALAPGTWLPVRMTDSYEYDLVGEPVEEAHHFSV